jgi:hypothetical protein
MDERLKNALEFANYRQTLNIQLNKAKVKTESLLILAKNGGSFHINQELISFLDYLQRQGLSQAVLLDYNNTPIRIEDVDNFLEEVTSRYFEVTNDYLREYQNIKKSRDVKSIIKDVE